MSKGGLADSPFFTQPTQVVSEPASSPVEGQPSQNLKKERVSPKAKKEKQMHRDTTVSRHHDTTVSSNHATVIPRHHDTVIPDNNDGMIENIRKSVKELGKEAATHRFTLEEKKAVLDLVYSYKGAGIRTHENEVTRIALNCILEDYKQNGQNSILDRVLKALNE